MRKAEVRRGDAVKGSRRSKSEEFAPRAFNYYWLVTMEDGLFLSYLLSHPYLDGKRVRGMLRALDKLVNSVKGH
jgi:hypothetical protein